MGDSIDASEADSYGGYSGGRSDGYSSRAAAMGARGRPVGVGRGSGSFQAASDQLLAMVKGGDGMTPLSSYVPSEYMASLGGEGRGHAVYRGTDHFSSEEFPALGAAGPSPSGTRGGASMSSSRRPFASAYEQQFPSLGGGSSGGSAVPGPRSPPTSSAAAAGSGVLPSSSGGAGGVHPGHAHLHHHHPGHHQPSAHMGHRSSVPHPHYAAMSMAHAGQMAPHMQSSSPPVMHHHQPPQPQSSPSPSPSPAPAPRSDRFEPYMLSGLLSLIRMTNPDLNTLAIGIDLATLGLNLSSPDNLSETFVSPFLDAPVRRGEPEYHLPVCYYVQMQPVMSKMSHFREDTLFYIFYTMPQDVLQIAAARALYNHNWRYHIELQRWLIRGSEPQVKTATYERGTYVFFEPTVWERQSKQNFLLVYEQLEEMPELPTKA